MKQAAEAVWGRQLDSALAEDESLSLAFDAAGKHLALFGEGAGALLFEVGSDAPPREIPVADAPTPHAPDDVEQSYSGIALDGHQIEASWVECWTVDRARTLLALIDDDDLRVVPLAQPGQGEARLPLASDEDSRSRALAFDPAGERLAVSDGTRVDVYEIAHLRALPPWRALGISEADGERVTVETARLLGDHVLVGSAEAGLWLVSLDDAQPSLIPGTEGGTGFIGNVVTAADGSALVWVSPKGLELIERAPHTSTRDGWERRLLVPPEGDDGGGRGVFAFHPGGELLGVSVERLGRAWVELREREGFALVARFESEAGALAGGFSPDGTHVAWAELSGLLQLWQLGDTPDCVALGRLQEGSLRDAPHLVAPSAEGAYFVANGGAVLYLPVGGELELWREAPDDEALISAGCSPGGRFLALPSPGRIEVWDLSTQAIAWEVGGRGTEFALPLSDGRLALIAASEGGRLQVLQSDAARDPAPAVTTPRPTSEGPFSGFAEEAEALGLDGEALAIHAQLTTALHAQLESSDSVLDGEMAEMIPEMLPMLARMLHAWADAQRKDTLTRVVGMIDELTEAAPRHIRQAVRALPDTGERIMDEVEALPELLEMWAPDPDDLAWDADEAFGQVFGENVAEALSRAAEGLDGQLAFEAYYRELWPLAGKLSTQSLADQLRQVPQPGCLAMAVLADHLVPEGARDPAPLLALATDDTLDRGVPKAVAADILDRWGVELPQLHRRVILIRPQLFRQALLRAGIAGVL